MTFPDSLSNYVHLFIAKFEVSRCPRSYFRGLSKHLPPRESFISSI